MIVRRSQKLLELVAFVQFSSLEDTSRSEVVIYASSELPFGLEAIGRSCSQIRRNYAVTTR